MKFLVRAVAPEARLAREERLAKETEYEATRARRDAEARFKREHAPSGLEAALAKYKEDQRYAATAPKQLKIEDSVYVSGTALRERKEEADRAIKQKEKKAQERA
jgi:hypothetical protein